MAECTPTVVISTVPIESSKLKIQQIKIKKITSLSPLTKNKSYDALETAISNFRQHIYNYSTMYNDVMKEKGIKSHKYSYVKKLFQAALQRCFENYTKNTVFLNSVPKLP